MSTWRTTKPLDLIRFGEEPPLGVKEWLAATRTLLENSARPVAVFSREQGGERRVWMALAMRDAGQICLTNTVFPAQERRSYPSFSADFPCMQSFECELYEQTGIEPEGHPWLRPVRCSDGWRKNGAPYAFYRVEGEEVHEVAVGPVHAGVIEPGHFRFQCHGEVILHLETQLGYQHRGIEDLLPRRQPSQQLVLVESIAGDSVIAHATAFCSAIEALADVSPSLRGQAVRGIAAELERLAMHLSTLGGIAMDIGFALPSAAFGGLRTAVINLTASICGNRFGRGWIIPGGVRFDLDPPLIDKARSVLGEVLAKFSGVEALLFGAPSALARMEETGAVTSEQARAAGLVGLAARASDVICDVRADFPYGIYRYASIPSPTLDSGDAYARAKLRALEIRNSIQFIFEQLDNLPAPKLAHRPGELAKNAFAIALAEGHRGEIAHVVCTGADGCISQVKIKDPSFHNWHGLALAVRENGISDFPLCNKSFDLSYAGHDL
ncbi:MAG: NADH-quinone oxidoreductase subunit C [Verrucomicrobiota bacterium]